MHLRPFILNSYKLRIVYALKQTTEGEIRGHTQRIYRGRTEYDRHTSKSRIKMSYRPLEFMYAKDSLRCPVCILGRDEAETQGAADYSKRTPKESFL